MRRQAPWARPGLLVRNGAFEQREVSSRRVAALLLASLAVLVGGAGCGGLERGTTGTARLWITRDRGATLLVDATVPAGQTLMRALRSRAKVETRYGGRFVQSIDGVRGSLSARHDWFWFVNGLAGDTSAAEYRLHPGDVAWWDYRDWSDDPELAVVVGAFPEPFLHGFDGHVHTVAVRYGSGLRPAAERISRRLRASSIAPFATPVPHNASLFVLTRGSTRFTAALRSPGSGPTAPVVLTFSGDVSVLLRGAFARRFSVP
jgi:hypothetical protein